MVHVDYEEQLETQLWKQSHRHDRWNEADGRHLWAKSISAACIKRWRAPCRLVQDEDHSSLYVLHLQKESSEKKKEITEAQPLAMRLASCKGAVDRAAAKRLACQEIVERAIQELQQAQVRERELGRNWVPERDRCQSRSRWQEAILWSRYKFA